MAFKINISEKGKTFNLEAEAEFLKGKKIGDKVQGKEIKPELKGYELEITGLSDKAGFPGKKDVEGQGLKKLLLKKGFGMKTRQRKEGKGKKRRLPKGFKQKKTVRGNTISENISQVNMNVKKSGEEKLDQVLKKQEKEVSEKEQEEKDKKKEKPGESKKKDEKSEAENKEKEQNKQEEK